MSASSDYGSPCFRSHPGHVLATHLKDVRDSADKLLASANVDQTVKKTVHYAALLHDIGKLNPYYQMVFNGVAEKTALENYPKQHSLFSARAAKLLLEKVPGVDVVLAEYIIAAHHSELRNSIGIRNEDSKMKSAKRKILENLGTFRAQISSIGGEFSQDWENMSWDNCLDKFGNQMVFDPIASTKKGSFITYGIAYSALLQADRGSFEKWDIPRFRVPMETEKLVKESNLSHLRQQAFDYIFKKLRSDAKIDDLPIVVIAAPTGIGKTRIFLKMAQEWAESRHFARLIYCSPLLALSDDIESKVYGIVPKEMHNEILVFNHTYAGEIRQEGDRESNADADEEANRWSFRRESFNYQMIITTTQRLLMSIYSNSSKDKLKLLALSNSLVIIDEVQTLPKWLLSNLIMMLKELYEKIGTQTVLVSATIPEEIKRAGFMIIGLPVAIEEEYMKATAKNIDERNPTDIQEKSGKVLVMMNTRKKAVNKYDELEAHKPIYITSGVRRGDRLKRLDEIRLKKPCLVVSTQAIEAGVDISFSEIFRECAPLDNIVQTMGRLDREGEMAKNGIPGTLHVFDRDNNFVPYGQLEMKLTKQFLPGIRTSADLYKQLPKYYKELTENNKSTLEYTKKLEEKEKELAFQEVWKMVSSITDDDIEVLIPFPGESVEDIKKEILNKQSEILKKFSNNMAVFPRGKLNDYNDLFDEEVWRKRGVLLPYADRVSSIYDENVGIDSILRDSVSI